MTEWQRGHGRTINLFLQYLNEQTQNYILKGGTALLICYRLDRFSEDIDLDGQQKNLFDIVDRFCIEHNFSYRIAKDTDTVKRCMINYGNEYKPLKVELSLRRKETNQEEVTTINGIRVYKIDALCTMKCNAYVNRDKIRDLYDLTFICNNHYESLSASTISVLQHALEYKGIEQFDYIMQTQKDELINETKLTTDFLRMFEKLGLLYDTREKNLIEQHIVASGVIVTDEKQQQYETEFKGQCACRKYAAEDKELVAALQRDCKCLIMEHGSGFKVAIHNDSIKQANELQAAHQVPEINIERPQGKKR